VCSEHIFKSIFTCVQDVAETLDDLEEKKQSISLKKPQEQKGGAYMRPEGQQKFSSSRQIPITKSKFAQRFNMTGSGMSSVSKELETRVSTPSTSSGTAGNTPDLKRSLPLGGDLSQWIKKPQGLGILG
jgi:hypothetical protein